MTPTWVWTLNRNLSTVTVRKYCHTSTYRYIIYYIYRMAVAMILMVL